MPALPRRRLDGDSRVAMHLPQDIIEAAGESEGRFREAKHLRDAAGHPQATPAPTGGAAIGALPIPDRRGENCGNPVVARSEEHTSELQSLMRISYAVFCLKKKNSTQMIQT